MTKAGTMRDIGIGRVMTTNPAALESGATIEQALSLFESEDLHHLPVVDDGKLAGLISSADLMKCYLLDGGADAAKSASVRPIMVKHPVRLVSSATLRDAALILSAGGFHALPVVEEDATLVGIVTSSDLIEHLLLHLPSGDGSLNERPATATTTSLKDEDLAAAVADASDTLKRGEENPLARAVLELRERNRHMRHVCEAAELYVRSGRAEHEHSVLIKALSALRERGTPLQL